MGNRGNGEHEVDLHVLIKLSVTSVGDSESSVEESPVSNLLQTLSVLDAFHYFGLDTEGLAKHVHLQPSVVKAILDR